MEENFCKDCVYFDKEDRLVPSKYARCKHNKHEAIGGNYISGKYTYTFYDFCKNVRGCNPSCEYYERKPTIKERIKKWLNGRHLKDNA